MTVYADVLVIVNLYVDYILLCCVRGFLHLGKTGGRLVLGALAGAFCGLMGLLPVPSWLSPALGGFCALAAAAAAFAPMRPRLFLRCWLCMWLFSFLLAGFLLFVAQFAPPGYMALVGGSVYLNLSLPVLFAATCLAYGVFWVFRRAFPREDNVPRLWKLSIQCGGRQTEIWAKADTGNALREPFSGLPVLICQAEALASLVPPAAASFLSGGNGEPSPGLRLVPFESVGGDGLLPAFKPDKVSDAKTGKELPCYIALIKKPLSSGQFSAIFNPDLFPD